MSSPQLIVIAIMLVAVVACVAGAWALLRRRSLQRGSGSEYDRVIAESETRLVGEQALRAQQRLNSSLELRELSAQARARYASRWRQLQDRFSDSPQQAVTDADDLVTRLLGELGYPTGDHGERAARLSDQHATTLRSYRDAHEISMSNRRGQATTEQLRLAFGRFRALVAEGLGEESMVPPPG